MGNQINNPRYNLSGYNRSRQQCGSINRHSVNEFCVKILHTLPIIRHAKTSFNSEVKAHAEIVVPHKINNYAYNLSRYNSGISQRLIFFRRHSINRINAVVAPTIITWISRHSLTELDAEILARRLVIMTKRNSLIELHGKAIAFKHLVVERRSLDEFNVLAYAIKDMYILRRGINELLSSIHVGKDVYIKRQDFTAILGRIHVGKHIIISRNELTYFNTSTQINLRDYLTMEIVVTIPAGGEIRINSDNFTVTQGQNNIIHLFRGDWIFIERATHTLRLEAATGGNIVGQLIYNERYI